MRFSISLTRWIVLGVVLGICGLLAGCADAPPTPTSIVQEATMTTPPIARVSTSTPSPAAMPTLTRAATSTPQLTDTPSPTWTSTPTPTATPSPTVPTLTPTPTATGEPSAQLETAQRHQTNGDYSQAIAAYLALLQSTLPPDQARLARYHLAESYLLNREYAAAADAWTAFIADYPDDGRLVSAKLMAARAYHAANECSQAIPYYEAYLAQATVLADMVYEWLGDCHAADGRLEEAIGSYQRALAATSDRSVQAGLREKIAGAYLALQDFSAAIKEYDAILNMARIDSYRAEIEYLAGQTLAAAGDTEGAHARYRRAVDSYPSAGYAYLSLVELVDAGVQVNEYQRGLVDYYAGASYPDAYGAAVRAFDRYLATAPTEKADAALYYKALVQRALDQPEAALETLEALIAGHPKSTLLPRSWWEKGATLAAMGRNDAAVKTYRDLAAFFPTDALAPQALLQAARLREGERAFAEGATLYQEVQASFPGFENADEALWRAGLAYYRASEREKAIANWQALLDKYPQSAYRSKSLYWLGKLGAQAASQGARGYWQQLTTAYPHTYYALRVEQIRSGESLTATRLITAAVEPLPWDAAQASTDILDWLQSWTQVPTDTNLYTPPVTLARRSDFQRGEALLAIGLRHEALGAFDSVRAAAWDDPVALAELALFFRDRGLHGLAARAASRMAALSKGTIRDAPLVVQRLAYPLVYADLLSKQAQERNLDPLLLAALIRQESLFEPAAESYAGARGLGQVMPATGEGIARSLKMDGFVLDDLYRPSVSIEFGGYYLAVQMKRFDDQVLVALAAYNGGPGNTLRWLDAGGDDFDLFVETITANQSRIYLQRVYEQYLVYETLYRPSQAGEP